MAALVVRSLIRSRLTVSRSFAANIDGREEGSADLGLLRVPKAGFHRDLNGGSDMVGKNIWANVNRCEREQQRTRTRTRTAKSSSEVLKRRLTRFVARLAISVEATANANFVGRAEKGEWGEWGAWSVLSSRIWERNKEGKCGNGLKRKFRLGIYCYHV